MSLPLRKALSTGEVADQINTILQASVYSDRAIRAEIDAGRIRAHSVGGGQRYRRRFRITPDEFLRWAQQVLRDEEMARLRSRLDVAS